MCIHIWFVTLVPSDHEEADAKDEAISCVLSEFCVVALV
jgi:hypothetical protein